MRVELIQNRKISKMIALFLILIVQVLCLGISNSMENVTNENSKRNWRESLNIYDQTGERIIFNSDEWFNSTLEYINPDNEAAIRSKCERITPTRSNVALARFTLIFNIEGEVVHITFDLGKTFVSGLNSLDKTNREVIENSLLDKIILPISFIDVTGNKRPSGKVINNTLKSNISNITGVKPNEGNHSEASILIYIFNNLKTYLSEKIDINKKPIIIGTILEISSLNDTCSKYCIPMLEAFMFNIRGKLSSYLPNFNIKHKLENIILLSGREEFEVSRDGINIVNDKININFEDPSNRIFSRKIDY